MIQLLGSVFGQDASTWNFGASAAASGADATVSAARASGRRQRRIGDFLRPGGLSPPWRQSAPVPVAMTTVLALYAPQQALRPLQVGHIYHLAFDADDAGLRVCLERL